MSDEQQKLITELDAELDGVQLPASAAAILNRLRSLTRCYCEFCGEPATESIEFEIGNMAGIEMHPDLDFCADCYEIVAESELDLTAKKIGDA